MYKRILFEIVDIFLIKIIFCVCSLFGLFGFISICIYINKFIFFVYKV